MPSFSLATSKAGINTANSVMWQLRSSATERVRLTELGLYVAVAPTTAPTFVLIRHTTLGTSSATLTPIPNEVSDAAPSAVLETAWSAQPTFSVSGPFLRLAALPITAGAGMIWRFPEPISISVSSGLIIANLNASGATLGTFGLSLEYRE